MDPFYLSLLLYVVALSFACVDLFVPSGGILLVLSSIVAIASILVGFQSSQTMGMSMLTLIIGSIPCFVAVAVRVWPHTPIGKRIILPPAKQKTVRAKRQQELKQFIGTVVVADTPLMPSGQIKIGNRRLNVLAETGSIEIGQAFKIVSVQDFSLLARPTDQSETPITDSRDSPTNEVSLVLPADELGLSSLDE